MYLSYPSFLTPPPRRRVSPYFRTLFFIPISTCVTVCVIIRISKMKSLAVFAAIVGVASASSGLISFGGVPDVVLGWHADSSNITFSLTCTPNGVNGPLAWCAVGMNSANQSSMVPAEIFWLAVDNKTSVALNVEGKKI